MTTTEMISEAGDNPVMMVEFRGHEVRSGKLKDGRAYTALTMRMEGIRSGRQVQVSQFLPDGSDPHTVSVPFKKGESCVLVATSITLDKGVLSARGQVHKLNGSPAATGK